jgi:hypothetical protein
MYLNTIFLRGYMKKVKDQGELFRYLKIIGSKN